MDLDQYCQKNDEWLFETWIDRLAYDDIPEDWLKDMFDEYRVMQDVPRGNREVKGNGSKEN